MPELCKLEEIREHEPRQGVFHFSADPGPFDRGGRTVDGRDFQAAAHHVDRIGAGAAADVLVADGPLPSRFSSKNCTNSTDGWLVSR